MTTERSDTGTAEAEARAFAEKVQRWAETLTPKEQAALREALHRAAGLEGSPAHDTQGFDAWNTFMGIAAAFYFGWGNYHNTTESPGVRRGTV